MWDITAVLPDHSIRARPVSAVGDAATIRLPAAYVAEHVELGYATSTARAQGITVDETHTIATPGMAREDLYVAMSRGRHHNHTYIALDQPDSDCPPGQRTPTAAREVREVREVREDILATTHAEQTATETWTAFHPDAPAPTGASRLNGATQPLANPWPYSHVPAPVPDSSAIAR